jgi:hypothetical protein
VLIGASIKHLIETNAGLPTRFHLLLALLGGALCLAQTAVLVRDGQMVEVDGAAGLVCVVSGPPQTS